MRVVAYKQDGHRLILQDDQVTKEKSTMTAPHSLPFAAMLEENLAWASPGDQDIDAAPPAGRPAAADQQAARHHGGPRLPCRVPPPAPQAQAAAAAPDRLPGHDPEVAPRPHAPSPPVKRSGRPPTLPQPSAGRCPPAASRLSSCAWHGRIPGGATEGSTANSLPSASSSHPPRCSGSRRPVRCGVNVEEVGGE
ncbi:MAG: hypothetical protein JWL99_831 [Streptomyces oryziradicis]|nr:hypothetical protein [Actinacidiphila oryziradicis]